MNNTIPFASLGTVTVTVTSLPATTSVALIEVAGLTFSTVKVAVVELAAFNESPTYNTVISYSPYGISLNDALALASLTVTSSSLPFTVIISFWPLIAAGTTASTVAVSPTLMETSLTVIGVSFLGSTVIVAISSKTAP